MWIRTEIGRERWITAGVYGPGSGRSRKRRGEIPEKCLQNGSETLGRERVIVMGDVNARVGDNARDVIVCPYGVPGLNESGEYLVGVCRQSVSLIGKTGFRLSETNTQTWSSVDCDKQSSLPLYWWDVKRKTSRCKRIKRSSI